MQTQNGLRVGLGPAQTQWDVGLTQARTRSTRSKLVRDQRCCHLYMPVRALPRHPHFKCIFLVFVGVCLDLVSNGIFI